MKGDDLLVGGSGADRFEPQAGNDTINGAGDNTASYNGSDGQHFFEYADSVRFSGDPNRFTISKENVKFSNNKAVFLTDVDQIVIMFGIIQELPSLVNMLPRLPNTLIRIHLLGVVTRLRLS